MLLLDETTVTQRCNYSRPETQTACEATESVAGRCTQREVAGAKPSERMTLVCRVY